jgi:hypothetical protein
VPHGHCGDAHRLLGTLATLVAIRSIAQGPRAAERRRRRWHAPR